MGGHFAPGVPHSCSHEDPAAGGVLGGCGRGANGTPAGELAYPGHAAGASAILASCAWRAGLGLWSAGLIKRHARVVEWQTRGSQKPLGATSCEFESHLGHHPSIVRLSWAFRLRGLFCAAGSHCARRDVRSSPPAFSRRAGIAHGQRSWRVGSPGIGASKCAFCTSCQKKGPPVPRNSSCGLCARRRALFVCPSGHVLAC